jgi:hypothetical protein
MKLNELDDLNKTFNRQTMRQLIKKIQTVIEDFASLYKTRHQTPSCATSTHCQCKNSLMKQDASQLHQNLSIGRFQLQIRGQNPITLTSFLSFTSFSQGKYGTVP